MIRNVSVFVSLLLSLLMLAAFSPAQSATTPGQTTTSTLPAGKTVKDSKGRTVKNGGCNENGSLKIKYTGKLQRNDSGEWEVTGEITVVENPASQGSEGPIEVNTNGEPTEVNLNKNGTDPGGHIVTNVNGGNATVNVGGNFNDPNVGGGNNTVNVTGNNNSGSGIGQGSGGTVHQGGHGNSWNSGEGSWTVRN